MFFVAVWNFASGQTTLLDSQNYYWRVNEEDGILACFDGYEWKTFGSKEHINKRILSIYEDQKKRIWISTEQSEIMVYLDSMHRPHEVENSSGINGFNIVDITESRKRIYFKDESKTLLYFDEKANQIKRAFNDRSEDLSWKKQDTEALVFYDKTTNSVKVRKKEIYRQPVSFPVEKGRLINDEWWLFSPKPSIEIHTRNWKAKHRVNFNYDNLPEMQLGWNWTEATHHRANYFFLGTDKGLLVLRAEGATLPSEVILQPSDYNITTFEAQTMSKDKNYLRLGAIHDLLVQGDTCWIATENGLFYFLLKTRTIKRIFLGSAYPRINALEAGSPLIFIKENRLFLLNQNKPEQSFLFGRVESIEDIKAPRKEQKFWGVYRRGGLFYFEYKGKKMLKKLIEESQSDQFKYIQVGNDGSVWGLTNGFLIRYNSQKKKEKYERFELSERIRANSFFIDEAKQSVVIFGSSGVHTLHFEQLVLPKERPFVHLENLKISGIDTFIYYNRFFELDYINRNLVVRYKAISVHGTDALVYKYRFSTTGLPFEEGTKVTKWQFTEQRELNFTLQGGTHLLEIVAVDKYGLESQPLRIQFRILPPFWKQLWFWVLMLLLVSVGIVVILWGQRRRLYRKNELLKMEVQMLQAQMNTHFIANALTAIQGFIMSNKKLEALDYIVDFHILMRLFLDVSRSSEHLLEEELLLIEKYIKLQQLFQNFSYSIDLGQDVYPNDLFVPTSLIQPFVENAIVHGLQYKQKGKKHLDIRFFRTTYELTIEIQDNGIGRAASRKINEANAKFKKFSTSISSKIIQTRLNILNNFDNYRAQVFYEDLYESDQPTGTKVIIKIKLPDKMNDLKN